VGAEWLQAVEARGLDYAIAHALPEHLEEVRGRTVEWTDRTMAAVNERLTKEIAYWDSRAEQLKDKELAGKKPKLNSGRARQRADDLQARRLRRLEELEKDKQLAPLPPNLLGAALVIPRGLIERLRGEREAGPAMFARETERVERLAVDAVMASERAVGRQPREMARNNKGFDIRSRDPITDRLYFVEVKGRVLGAETVTVTKNEILTGLNEPDQFVLALVAVDGGATDVRYLTKPFRTSEDSLFDVTSVNYTWDALWERAGTPEPADHPPVQHWIDLMVERLATQFSPEQIVLFGSHARGDADGDSDVDLLVVLPEVENRREAAVDMRRALSDLPVAKDIVVTTPAEIDRRGHLVGSVLRPALREGKVLYGAP